MGANSTVTPVPNVILKKSDLEDESLSLLNQILSSYQQQLDVLRGVNGPISLSNHLDLAGHKIINVGAAESPNDVVTQAFASSNYGPQALAAAFNALGKQTLQTYRQLSNPDQRERTSSFLNDIANTSPTSNTSTISYGSVSGGTIPVTVSAGFFQRVDGTATPYASRTDTLALPTSIAISSLTRSGNIVTAVTTTPDGLSVNEGFSVSGAPDPSFDGAFSVLTVSSPDTFTYFQGGPNAGPTAPGGSISVGGVYYYTISAGQSFLGLVSGVGADTWSERVGGSHDGTTIIAVVVLNSGGIDVLNSAAGATSPQNGVATAVIRRL